MSTSTIPINVLVWKRALCMMQTQEQRIAKAATSIPAPQQPSQPPKAA